MKAGWKVKSVGEVADHCLGKMLDKRKNKGVPRPYLRNLNVRWFDFDLDDVLEMKFEEHETERYTAVRGDVLVCEGGYPGRAAIWEHDEPIYFQKALHRVRFHEPARNRWFLYYLLKCDLDGSLQEHFTGSGIQHFTGKALAKLPIPLPPLEEQQRIVAILDEAFEGLDRAKANAEANLASAKELFQAALGEALNPPDAVKAGWEEVALGDLCLIARGGSPRPIKAYLTDADDGINWIKIGDTQAGGRYIDSTAERIKPEGKSKSRFVEPGAFLLSNSMSFGRPYVLRTSGCIHDGWLVLDPDYSRIDQAYLYYSLISPATFAQFDRAAAGSTVRNLNTSLASKVTIPLPPLEEQQRIVEQLDEVRDRTSSLEAYYASAKENTYQLRQSLLTKAFAGELT